MASERYTGGYLADDAEMKLRGMAPVTCRLCRHLLAKHSVVLEQPLFGCNRPLDAHNSEILAQLLMDRAKDAGQCSFFSGL
jgi:hypothetical protein